jgi:hypothetical protein
MKRKIGEIYNKPIVEGDKNLVRGGAEIHINDLQTNNSSSGGSSKYAPRYFSIDWNKADEGWKYSLCADNIGLKISSISKNNSDYGPCINTFGVYLDSYNDILAFCFQPLYISKQLIEEAFGITEVTGHIDTIQDAIYLLNKLISIFNHQPYTLSMNGITEITEEEFYKID